MPLNVVWEKAIRESQLKAGWHLARTDLRGAFLHDILCTEAFAFDLQRQIKELARQLETETFTPTHCIPIAGKHQATVLEILRRHPHPGVAMAGGFFNDLRVKEGRGRNFLQYLFTKNAWTRVVDWLGVLWLVAESEQKRTLLDLKSRLEKLDHPCEGIVPIVKELLKRTEQTLARIG